MLLLSHFSFPLKENESTDAAVLQREPALVGSPRKPNTLGQRKQSQQKNVTALEMRTHLLQLSGISVFPKKPDRQQVGSFFPSFLHSHSTYPNPSTFPTLPSIC